jgi:osmotically-inducible protein OsmY
MWRVGLVAAACLLGGWEPPSKEKVATTVDDAWITAKVKAELAASKDVKARQVEVTTEHGVVKLRGLVDNGRAAERAVDLARGTTGVKKVESSLQFPTHRQPSRVNYPDGPPPSTDD